MADFIITPNMGLIEPTPGKQLGPQYAIDINNCLTIIDGHNHSPGYGVPIPTTGININADLPFNNNSLTGVKTVTFNSQSASLPGTVLGAIYEVNGELYYNSGLDGFPVPITNGHSVNAGAGSITGLPSGTASATYSAITQTFIFQSATSTPANIDGASYIFRNLAANSKGLTLSPPAAMAADFALTLPTLPPGQQIMTLDNLGNIAAPYTVDGTTIVIASNVIGVPSSGIGSAQLAASAVTTTKIADGAVTAVKIASGTITTTQISGTAGITGSQLANNTVTRTQEAAVGEQLSNILSSFNTTSTTFSDIPNMTVTLTTTGRPVVVALQSSDGVNAGILSALPTSGASAFGQIRLLRDGTSVAIWEFGSSAGSLGSEFPASLSFVDTSVSAASHVYKFQLKATTNTSATVFNTRTIAYEL